MNKNKYKVLVFALIVIIIIMLNHHYRCAEWMRNQENWQGVKRLVDENLLLALSIYTIGTVVGCVLLALPGVVFALISGMLFGPFWGIACCLVATTIGAMISFIVGRFFLKDAIGPMLEKNKTLKKLLFSEDEKSETLILMITRMVPIFPFNLQNFAYGITNISFWKYSVLTFIFLLPGVSFFTIGAAGITAEANRGVYFGTALVLAAAVTGAGIWIQRKYLKKSESEVSA